VSGSYDSTLILWDVSSGTCLSILRGHINCVSCVLQLSDGRLVSGSGDRTLILWDVSSGTCLSTLRWHAGGVSCVLQLTDGRLVSGSGDRTLRLWNTKSVIRQRLERRLYFLLLIDTCHIISATPEDLVFLRRQRDASRLEQLLRLLEDIDILQLMLRVQGGDEDRLVVCPSISEIFVNLGMVELITRFL
jgi:hypothetical protein